MPPRSILVITGASGSGKTAILRHLAPRVPRTVSLQHFDSVGVPDPEEMFRQFGSGEAWQEATTHQWITRLSTDPANSTVTVLEGQARPAYVLDAFRTNRVQRGRILLLDCSPAVRAARLADERHQPDLASDQMMAWAAYLRGQAEALHVPVLDTTALSLEAAAREVEQHIVELLSG